MPNIPPELQNDIAHLSYHDNRLLLEAVRLVEGKTGKKVQSLSELLSLAAEILQVPTIRVIGLTPQQLLEELRSSEQPAVRESPPTTQTARTASAEPTNHATFRAASIYAGNIADERLREIEAIIASDRSIDEKLEEIDRRLPIPSNAKARQLARALGVHHTAVLKTNWWKRVGKGRRQEEVEERRQRLKARGQKGRHQEEIESDDD